MRNSSKFKSQLRKTGWIYLIPLAVMFLILLVRDIYIPLWGILLMLGSTLPVMYLGILVDSMIEGDEEEESSSSTGVARNTSGAGGEFQTRVEILAKKMKINTSK